MTLPWWGAVAVLASWSAGITTAVLLRLPWVPTLAGMLAFILFIMLFHREFGGVVLFAGVAFVLGIGRVAMETPAVIPASFMNQEVVIAGRIDDDPVPRRNGTRVVIAVDRLLVADGQHRVAFRIVTTLFGQRRLRYGDTVLLSGRLVASPAREQFDYPTYLARQGIEAILDSPRLERVIPHRGDPLHSFLFAVRHALVHAVDRVLPEPQAALLLGVVFGYRAALPQPLEERMIASGLIHIIVISGLKVSLLARLVHQLLGRVLPRAAPVVALFAMFTYALLAGASAAALRATAMGALVVLAGVLRRDTQVFASMALTAAVMLGLKPDLARDVSFQLSFVGTLGIASFTDAIAARLPWIPHLLRDPFAATIAAEAATWPLMLADFHQLSLVAPLANALVLPLLPIMMVIGGGGAIAGAIWLLAGWPWLQLAGLIALWFQRVIDASGSLPFAAVVSPYFPARWVAAAALLNTGALVGLRLRRFFWQRRVWAVLAGSAMIVAALLLVRPDGRVHVYALDVGTGSAVLVRTANGEHVLVDGGPDADRFAQAAGRALPPTARRLRLWLITGGGRGQIGAGSAVLTRFQVDRMVIADPDPWTPTLRSLVDGARRAGVHVEVSTGSVQIDSVRLAVASDERTWLVRSQQPVLAIIPPDTSWHGFPEFARTAIFTRGGPDEWSPLNGGGGIAVIQVATMSRDGLPAHGFLQSVNGARVLRTDRLGTVELVERTTGWEPAR